MALPIGWQQTTGIRTGWPSVTFGGLALGIHNFELIFLPPEERLTGDRLHGVPRTSSPVPKTSCRCEVRSSNSSATSGCPTAHFAKWFGPQIYGEPYRILYEHGVRQVANHTGNFGCRRNTSRAPRRPPTKPKAAPPPGNGARARLQAWQDDSSFGRGGRVSAHLENFQNASHALRHKLKRARPSSGSHTHRHFLRQALSLVHPQPHPSFPTTARTLVALAPHATRPVARL